MTLRLDGGPAANHRVPVTDLLTVAGELQKALRNVAAVLVHQPSGQGGRKLLGIEAATELEFVATPRKGSFEVDLELAPAPPTLAPDQFPRIGDEALEALVDGISDLRDDEETLPSGFDRGVLRNLATAGRVFSKGYTGVELQLNGAARPRTANLNGERVGVIKRLIRKPLRAQASVEGVLQMVDLAARPLECRIDRPYLPSVTCFIANECEEQVRAAHGRRVRVEGEGEFAPESREPKRMQVSRLVVLPELPGIDAEEFRRSHTWRELAAEQGAQPILDARALATDVFDSDDEFDAFLASLRAD